MSEIWSFVETREGLLQETGCKMAAESRRTAKIFDADACGIIRDPHSNNIPEELKWYGLKKVYILRDEPMASPETMAYSLQLAVLKFSPQVLLFAGSSLDSEIAARTAALLQRGIISNCIDFKVQGGQPLARKAVYGGKADAMMTWMTSPPWLATIDFSALENVRERSQNEPEIIIEKSKTKAPLTKLVGRWEVGFDELDLSEARVVVGIGRGVQSGEFMGIITRLAHQIKGIVGGTRIAVYSGLIPLERQIGTTGKWIDSDLYLTLGVSGAPQHVMGIKDVKNIIAINISREAPIFKYARLGIIGNLYEIVPKLIDIIEINSKKNP